MFVFALSYFGFEGIQEISCQTDYHSIDDQNIKEAQILLRKHEFFEDLAKQKILTIFLYTQY